MNSINLSLSSLCQANCIFCPSDKGEHCNLKIMPFEYAKQIIDEISSDDFKTEHYIKKIEIGENGDALLNPDFLKIIRYIKHKLPDIKLELFTNMFNLNADLSKIVVEENLIHNLVLNIDGSTPQSYQSVKRLPFETVIKNLKDFINLNQSVSITINVVTLEQYLNTVVKHLGVWPNKVPKDIDIKDRSCQYFQVVKMLKTFIKDNCPVYMIPIFFWAERDQFKDKDIDYTKYTCQQLFRVETEAFISPNGNWYACCLDSKNEIVFGNVIETSISTVYRSSRRAEIIKMLKDKKFSEIGGPCRTINCCQSIRST